MCVCVRERNLFGFRCHTDLFRQNSANCQHLKSGGWVCLKNSTCQKLRTDSGSGGCCEAPRLPHPAPSPPSDCHLHTSWCKQRRCGGGSEPAWGGAVCSWPPAVRPSVCLRCSLKGRRNATHEAASPSCQNLHNSLFWGCLLFSYLNGIK